MFQELDAESGAFGRALDHAGDVGDDKAVVAGSIADHAEVRIQRRERIVCDLRRRRRHRANERGLAGIRKAEQADIGQQLEFEAQARGFRHRACPACARRGERLVEDS
jgi:hypothetical protein